MHTKHTLTLRHWGYNSKGFQTCFACWSLGFDPQYHKAISTTGCCRKGKEKKRQDLLWTTVTCSRSKIIIWFLFGPFCILSFGSGEQTLHPPISSHQILSQSGRKIAVRLSNRTNDYKWLRGTRGSVFLHFEVRTFSELKKDIADHTFPEFGVELLVNGNVTLWP